MNAQELNKVQQEIRDAIYAHAIELGYDNNIIEPITDGVCDFEGYLKSNPKIMWILKEPNGKLDSEILKPLRNNQHSRKSFTLCMVI